MTSKGSRAKERREQRERQRRRNRNFTIGFVVIAVIAVVIVLALVSTAPAEAPVPEDVFAKYEGIETGLTEDGYPILGDPDAPVSVVEYSNFSCPACQAFHDNVYPQLFDRVRSGQISFTFVPITIDLTIPNSEGAARAALCAGEERFWAFHDVLFQWQAQFGNTAFSSNRLAGGAEALGLDLGSFQSCFNSSRITDTINNALAEGVTGTPTLQVNGATVDNPQDITSVNAAIDAAFAPFADDFVPLDAEETPEVEPTDEPTEEPTPTDEPTDEPAAESTEEATEEATAADEE